MNALLALVLLLQETPEEAFRKIEAVIEGARTIRVKFSTDVKHDVIKPTRSSLVIEEGERFTLESGFRSANDLFRISASSDGKVRRSTLGEKSVEAKVNPRFFRSNLNTYLTRLGICMGAAIEHGTLERSATRPELGESIVIDLKQMFQVQDVRAAGDGKGGSKMLTYELKSAVQPMPLSQLRIWYDPKTYKLLRRESRIEMKTYNLDLILIEDFDEIEIDDAREPAAGPDVKVKPPPPPPIPDSELDTLFFKAKLQVAESHLQSGKKDKAIEVLEDAIKTYPKHSLVPEARRLLEQARKK
jgi:hypothetical protein